MSSGLLGAVNAIGGLVFGINIGYVPAFMAYSDFNADCANNLDNAACLHNTHVSCTWSETNSTKNVTNYACLFKDSVICNNYTTKAECGGVSACVWDYQGSMCGHAYGWESWQKGFFSGAMIIGGLFGTAFTGWLLAKFGRKKVIGAIGLVALIGAALMFVARFQDSYSAMIIARIIVGLSVGAVCVACPLYVGEMAPLQLQGPLGVVFQVGITFGIVLEAFLAFALQPSRTGIQHWEERIQWGLTFPCALASLGLMITAFFIPESKVWLNTRGFDAMGGDTTTLDELLLNTKRVSRSEVALPLIVAVVLSFATQMTGINAIMNYAPSITKAVGLEPLTGNLVVMIWNFLTALASVPITKFFPRRSMYLTCLIVCTIACFLTGIPTFPGMVADSTGHALSSVGIAVFILAFEIGVGPLFFVMATELFPPSFKNTGSSFTNTAALVFNLIMNFCFPIAVEGLSGGPTGDQNKGMAIVFMIFGGVGVLSTVLLLKFLHPWKGD